MPSCQTPTHSVPSRDHGTKTSKTTGVKATVHEFRRLTQSTIEPGKPSTLDWGRLRPLLAFIAVFAALGVTAMIYAHLALN